MKKIYLEEEDFNQKLIILTEENIIHLTEDIKEIEGFVYGDVMYLKKK